MGAAHVRILAGEGARVVFGDVLDADGEALAADIGPSVTYLHLDVTNRDDWRRAIETAQAIGPLNGLVNNAAIHATNTIADESVEQIRRVFEVNFIGTFLGVQSVTEPMTAAGGGSIVNVSSTGGLTGLPSYTAYGASKWAVRGFTKTAAIELGPLGIRVNSVHPGPIRTAMLSIVGDERTSGQFAGLPLRRPGEPEEVSRLMVYLISDESSFQTGAEFVIDGGSTAGPARVVRHADTS